jgi:chromosome segregation ATPase
VLFLKFEDLDSRLLKLQNEFKSYQQKFQYTIDDINARENKSIQLEYELEEVSNQSQLLKSQNQELLNTTESLKNDYEQLMEQKRNAEKEITRLETTLSEIQMNFTSSHQQLKKEVLNT